MGYRHSMQVYVGFARIRPEEAFDSFGYRKPPGPPRMEPRYFGLIGGEDVRIDELGNGELRVSTKNKRILAEVGRTVERRMLGDA